ncbi:dna cross-link repair protein snm1 [Ophiostoma piceae UAMH 11346]|uniref:Dna cross-link repair protein snm1 n=1 Tax=Ophiostoma piceae (strain UAMH 11346) TaxID=1262450 RepID=S3CPH6_OPHP1|nr:dna cross-link repair protein snm1 [Ophiostoma piceae UAMH 11346]
MPTPTISRARSGGVQTTMANKSKTTSSPSSKANAKSAASAAAAAPPNQSILSFFKKVPPPEESMFMANSTKPPPRPFFPVIQKGVKSIEVVEERKVVEVITYSKDKESSVETRFNECTASNKRRRLSQTEPSEESKKITKPVTRGPFVDDSDSEDEGKHTTLPANTTATIKTDTPIELPADAPLENLTSFDETFVIATAPAETKDSRENDTPDACNDFSDIANELDLDNDDDFEGEEFRERKYMEQQAILEAEQIALAGPSEDDDSCCPICSASLAGKTPDQATIHVNACLDGGAPATAIVTEATPLEKTPTTPTTPSKETPTTATTTSPITSFSKRFMRTAQPRPGQANPIGLHTGGQPGKTTGPVAGSAFTKLMSGHAEDAAWATAAAAETASRGKPAYERTCPFYKIMPGVFRAICVDAFRYGAVEGCRAYFLSHFHSDHYIGLTAKWCHGPIYCSRVTGSLVRNQLGTAAKWVVDLDFDETVDVPGTDGVRVTMIPANHCPGSSLFLFEKNITNAPRPQRILHCGDFRACRAHVDHPLLMPSVVDTVTHKTRQQRIDVCYLDTTYLNPKYSFPPQGDVITACASICALLDQSVRAGRQGEWDRILRRRQGTAGNGSGNVKGFFEKKPEAGNSDPKHNAPQDAFAALAPAAATNRHRLLVVCGTYSIGKERICKAIAQALNSKIYASPAKIKIVAQLGDPELSALMTSNPTEAQVHMQMLMELRAETLADYLSNYRGHFSHIVGFRPSGWNYRPSMANSDTSKAATNKGIVATAPSASLSPSTLATTTLLHHAGWRTRFGARDLVAQRGSNGEAMCFGVPYSEHSSFRELALFLMTLRIDKVVPTVNVGSDVSRKRMKGWIDRWLAERRRGGLVDVVDSDDEEHGSDKDKDMKLWDGKEGLGGSVYW